jgi:chromosome segregation ATPase
LQSQLASKDEENATLARSLQDHKDEVYKAKDELKGKSDMYNKACDSYYSENFKLQQEVEQLNHKLLMQNTEIFSLRGELEARKCQIIKLDTMLKNKERGYDDIKRCMNDMQFQMEKLRRSKGDYNVSPYDIKFGGHR